MSAGLRSLTLVTAVGCGAMGGVFFAFSSFVMPGLCRLPAPQAVAAMQSINITAVRPALMTGLFGTAAACLLLGVLAVRRWGDRPSALQLAGSCLYLVGVIGVTAAYHVPRNDRLAVVDPDSAAAVELWRTYLSSWTTGNHVRTVAGIAAAVLLTLSLAERDG